MLVITRFCSIHFTRNFGRAGEYRSLYRELRYTEARLNRGSTVRELQMVDLIQENGNGNGKLTSDDFLARPKDN